MISNLKRSALVVYLIAFVALNLAGQVFPVEVIRYAGPPNEFLNIVIVGDGYTASQQDKFIADSKNAFLGFFSEQPFSDYKDSINVFAIKVESNVSGASLDPNNLIDNYFGSSYNSYGIERLLVAWRNYKIVEVLNQNTPFFDEAVIMVNDSKYGGSGGQYAVFSIHSQSIDLLLHEFGHSFSDLGDEYWAGAIYATEKANRTQNSDPATIRWKEFLNINLIGIYPHEEEPTWFRPHQNCLMRYLGKPYCTVCNNEITIDIESYVNYDTLGVPVAWFAANKLDVRVEDVVKFQDMSTKRPKSWEWSFPGGTPATSNLKNPEVIYTEPGEYSATLTVTNEQGNNTYTKSDYIKVAPSLASDVLDFIDDISIYPNPAEKSITISTYSGSPPRRYRIFNATGNIVKEGELENQIFIGDLPSGFYFAQFTLENRVIVKKIIKN